MQPRVGVIANPISGRDIRRVVAKANSLQIADRANMLARALAGLAAFGVTDVVMMPERGGIAGHVLRQLSQAARRGEAGVTNLTVLKMPVTGGAEDTRRAARIMADEGVAAIIVLGGDGTHRIVASACGETPIASMSTGTNNAFPDMREPTVTGYATGLVATGAVPRAVGVKANKWLEVRIDDEPPEVALVDVAIVTQQNVGARALWRTETFRELYVAFADPQLIGMSAIAGLIEPVGRRDAHGLMLNLTSVDAAPTIVPAPIAPGLIEKIGIENWRRLAPQESVVSRAEAGSVALDGERELCFGARQKVSIRLVEDAFNTIDVAATMCFAAQNGALRRRAPAYA